MENPNFETRIPKEFRRPKSENVIGNIREIEFGFGFRTSFGVRHSAFGFETAYQEAFPPQCLMAQFRHAKFSRYSPPLAGCDFPSALDGNAGRRTNRAEGAIEGKNVHDFLAGMFRVHRPGDSRRACGCRRASPTGAGAATGIISKHFGRNRKAEGTENQNIFQLF
jgi:hypothetical protein